MKPNDTLHQRAAAFKRWLSSGDAAGLAEAGFAHDRPADEIVLTRRRDLDLSGRKYRAMSDQLQTGGSYSVAEIMAAGIDFQLKFFAAVRKYATVVVTPTGGPFIYPLVQDFDNEGIEIPENTLMSSEDIEQFGQAKLFARKIGSQWLLVPNELLEDSALALVDWLSRIVGERCGRFANRRYTETLTASCPTGVTTAAATAIAADEILSLYYGVDAAYRDSETAGWLLHSDMTKYLRQLKGSDGRYLFRKSRKPGSPDTLLGKPIAFNYHMSSAPTASTVSAFFGDLSRVLIRDVEGVRVKRAVERWADYDQVGVAGFLRTSAAVLDLGGKPIQALLQHS